MMRRLIHNQRSCIIFQFFQYGCTLFFLLWQKCLEGKAACRQTGQRQCGNAGCCPRKGSHFNALLVADAHQIFTRIGNARCTRIGDQRNIRSLLHFFHQLIGFIHFVVLVVAGQRCFYIKMIQQMNGISGVFRRDQINFF